MLCSFPPIIVVQSDCGGKIYHDSNYSEMSLVICNEPSIATSQSGSLFCSSEIRNETKVCVILVGATHPVQDMAAWRHLLVFEEHC